MTDTNQKQLGNTLWSIADQLRGAMDADDFRDYMLSFLFLRYLSDMLLHGVKDTEFEIFHGDIQKIIDTYQHRKEETRYSRRVDMAEIGKNDFNLNISRYISTAVTEEEVDLKDTNQKLAEIGKSLREASRKHNRHLKELGLPLLP